MIKGDGRIRIELGEAAIDVRRTRLARRIRIRGSHANQFGT
jgi:hypothetical protein